MGSVAMVRGQVYLARTQLMHPELVTQAYPLYVDDTLESQSQSGIQFSVHPSTRLCVGPDSRLAIQDSSDSRQAIIALDRGTLRIAIVPQEDQVFAIHILAGGSRVTVEEGEATVWVLEERNEPYAPGPYVTTIQNVGVINHGTRGEVTFSGMDQTVVVHPGFLSVTTPNAPPVQALAIDAAKPFATYIMQTTDLERHPNETTAITVPIKPSKPVVTVTAEPATQRDCKKKKSKAHRSKPGTEKAPAAETDCG
jgi:hypothetical protein